jgi:release factor glutamine methyltransferase
MALPAERALDLLGFVSRALAAHGVPDPERDAAVLVSEAMAIDTVAIYRDNPSATERARGRLEEMVLRRCGREPLQYITGRVEFFGLRLGVGRGVLIPRPETELLVEEALRRLPGDRALEVLDLCTGSGCLALAVASNLPAARVTGTDLSAEAIRCARENARANGVGNVTFLEGRLFEPVGDALFDAILSNPPYVESGEIPGLAPEVRDWEPRAALDGGPDGLDFFRLILPGAEARLGPAGLLIMEVGQGQAARVSALAVSSGLRVLSVFKDLAGIDRAIVARKA